MKKDITQFLNLYLGQEVQGNLTHKLIGIDGDNAILFSCEKKHTLPIEKLKLLLRPLADMRQDEIKEIADMVYQQIYSHKLKINNFSIPITEECGIIFFDEDKDKYGLTIEIHRGIEFSCNGKDLMVNQFDCILYLLKQGFDLFSLIDAGLAIDKTKMK